MRRLFQLGLLTFSLGLGCSTADAEIVLNFSRTDSGGVRVTGSGSGPILRNRNQQTWEMRDFNTDFLDDAIGTFSLIDADSVRGTLSSSDGASSSIIGFNVNRNSGGGDDLSWTTASRLKLSQRHTYTFELEAIFEAGTLNFANLLPGIHFDPGGNRDEIFGSITVNVSAVPEPHDLGLVCAGLGLLALAITRRGRKTQLNLNPGILALTPPPLPN